MGPKLQPSAGSGAGPHRSSSCRALLTGPATDLSLRPVLLLREQEVSAAPDMPHKQVDHFELPLMRHQDKVVEGTIAVEAGL
jgi:hypothetical protein